MTTRGIGTEGKRNGYLIDFSLWGYIETQVTGHCLLMEREKDVGSWESMKKA